MLTEHAVVKALQENGTTHWFGFPGETTLPLYNAMEDAGVFHFLARDERCAAHMADAYARITGKTGVCDAPAGMGVPFLCPALLEAYNSSSPVLAVVSSTPLDKRGRWPTSELDQAGLLSPITKAQFLVADAETAAKTTHNAYREARKNRPRPVLLEITYDLFGKNSGYERGGPIDPVVENAPDKLIRAAASALASSKKPAILAGGGVFLSGAERELKGLCETLGIPVATTLTGKGCLPEDHPLSLGVVGGKGRPFANIYVSSSDCVLVLGSKLGEKATNRWTLIKNEPSVIRVDIDEKELANNYPRATRIRGDIKKILKKMVAAATNPTAGNARTRIAELKKAWLDSFEKSCEYPGTSIKPQTVIRELQRLAPKNTILVADGSVSSGWAGACWNANGTGRRFIAGRGTGMIGFALPAAIGAKIGAPNDPVVSLAGDGGFMFSAEELEAAKRHGIPFVQIIFNNSALGLLQLHEQYVYKRSAIPSFSAIDFCRLSEALGAQAIAIDRKSEVPDGIRSALHADGPVVLDVKIDASELSPDFKNTLARKGIRI